MIPNVRKYSERLLQGPHGVPGLALEKWRQQNDIPVLNRKNDSDEDFVLFAQFVQLTVFFQYKVLKMWLFQLSQRYLRESDNLH